jgi:hypothetical protein
MNPINPINPINPMNPSGRTVKGIALKAAGCGNC